jgi:low affinity Fe/Cu permease
MVFLIQNTQNRDCEAMVETGRTDPRHSVSAQRPVEYRRAFRSRTDQIKRHYERLAQKAGEACAPKVRPPAE